MNLGLFHGWGPLKWATWSADFGSDKDELYLYHPFDDGNELNVHKNPVSGCAVQTYTKNVMLATELFQDHPAMAEVKAGASHSKRYEQYLRTLLERTRRLAGGGANPSSAQWKECNTVFLAPGLGLRRLFRL